jgi:hypothetical protein
MMAGVDPEALRFWQKPILARRNAVAVALCGDPGPSQWTTQRCALTCRACAAEVERRVAARDASRRAAHGTAPR